MSWIISVAPTARDQLRDFDPSLLHEVIEHVEAIAESQGFGLALASGDPPLGGLWMHQYESSIIERLVVMLYFADVAGRPGRLALSVVRHHSMPEELAK